MCTLVLLSRRKATTIPSIAHVASTFGWSETELYNSALLRVRLSVMPSPVFFKPRLLLKTSHELCKIQT